MCTNNYKSHVAAILFYSRFNSITLHHLWQRVYRHSCGHGYGQGYDPYVGFDYERETEEGRET